MPGERRGGVPGEVWAAAALAALDCDPMFYGRGYPTEMAALWWSSPGLVKVLPLLPDP